jgi:hypothetical protein
MSDEQRRHGPKDRRKKNGRPEERPSSGRKRPGRAAASQSRIAIPRCSNMTKLGLVRKTQSITVLDRTPQKAWKNLSQLPDFSSFAASFGNIATQHCAKKVNAADSSHRRIHATKDSRGSAIPALVKAGDARWPKLRGSKT